MPEKRIKTGIALLPSAIELCDKNRRLARAHSRNEFVEKAIEFYSGYLNADSNPEFYEEMYSSRWEQAVKKTGDTLIRGQFRLAVEVSKLAHLIAATNNIPDSMLKDLAQRCVAECKDLAGIWSTEDIVRFQKRYER